LDHFSVTQNILYEPIKLITYSIVDICHFSGLGRLYSSRFADFLTMLVFHFFFIFSKFVFVLT